MEGYCSTGQIPQWAVVPMEEEEEVGWLSSLLQARQPPIQSEICHCRIDTLISPDD